MRMEGQRWHRKLRQDDYQVSICFECNVVGIVWQLFVRGISQTKPKWDHGHGQLIDTLLSVGA